MERTKGVRISIYPLEEKGRWGEEIRQYQDPEGWAISDAGLNEDETGYHFSVEARGIDGERAISFVITRDGLQGMLDAVDARFNQLPRYATGTYNSSLDFKIPFEFGQYVDDVCNCDGCLCQPKASV